MLCYSSNQTLNIIVQVFTVYVYIEFLFIFLFFFATIAIYLKFKLIEMYCNINRKLPMNACLIPGKFIYTLSHHLRQLVLNDFEK